MLRKYQFLFFFVIVMLLKGDLFKTQDTLALGQRSTGNTSFWRPLPEAQTMPDLPTFQTNDDYPTYNRWHYDIYEPGDAIWAGDINQDGWDDIVFGTQSARLRIWLQNPICHEVEEWLDLPTRVTPYDLAVADINQDGKLDIAIVGAKTNSSYPVLYFVQVFYFSADRYQTSGTLYSVGDFPRSIEIGDVNGDAKPDLLVSSVDVLDVLIQSNDGSFHLTIPNAPSIGAYARPNDMVISDFNNDMRNDVAVQIDNSENRQDVVVIYYQNSSGDLNTGIPLPWAFSPESYVTGTDMTGGDVTGDGKTDLIVTCEYNTPLAYVVIYAQLPTGGFAQPTTLNTYDLPTSPNLADMNQDGKLDLVLMHHGYGAFTVHFQLPEGGLGPESRWPAGDVGSWSYLHFSDVADVTGDGKQDVIYLNTNDGLMIVAQGSTPLYPKNTPPRAKIPHILYATINQLYCEQIVSGDIDGDGLGDFLTIILTDEGAVVQVIRQLPDGTFTLGIKIPLGTNVPLSGLSVGDLNGDGRLDIAATDFIYWGHTEVDIVMQGPNGNFLPPNIFSVAESPIQTFIEDWTGDGREDLGIMAYYGFFVLVQQDDGTLSAPIHYITQDQLHGTTISNVVDWNRDGHMDLIAYWNNYMNPWEDPIRVFLQEPGTGFTMIPTMMFDYAHAIVTGDLNNDSLPDIAISHPENTPLGKLGLIFQLPNGLSSDRKILSARHYQMPGDMAIADLNFDGLNDLLVMNIGGFGISAFTQNQQHTFDAPTYYPIEIWNNDYRHSIAGVDTDGDAAPDVFAHATGDNYVLLLKPVRIYDIFLPLTIH